MQAHEAYDEAALVRTTILTKFQPYLVAACASAMVLV